MSLRRRVGPVITLILLWGLTAAPPAALGQHAPPAGHWFSKHNPFRVVDPSEPITVPELCRRLDRLAEKIRDDGMVVLKQPDIFSQARMTRFRNDFERQMSDDLAKFRLVLAARINRLDAATTTQTTALSGALGGAKAIEEGPKLQTFDAGTSLDLSKGAFGGLKFGKNTLEAGDLSLGIEPTIYLDEKKRFLEHLNQIRRINLGPDQNDSSGYGLYLIRMPVSITPGERTYNGHGAELAVHLEHEFPAEFLPTTFQAMVINDIVDQLGPVVYEALRSGYYDKHLKPWYESRAARSFLRSRLDQLVEKAFVSGSIFASNLATQAAATQSPSDVLVLPVVDFVLAPTKKLSGFAENDLPLYNILAERLGVLVEAEEKLTRFPVYGQDPNFAARLAEARASIERIRAGDNMDPFLAGYVKEALDRVVQSMFSQATMVVGGKEVPLSFADSFSSIIASLNGKRPAGLKFDIQKWELERIKDLARRLYRTATSDDIASLNAAFQVDGATAKSLLDAAEKQDATVRAQSKLVSEGKALNLPSTRTDKQRYPIAPRDVLDVFFYENIYILAKAAKNSSRTPVIRSTDVRNFLRQTLSSAYAAMTYPTPKSVQTLPLDDEPFIHLLLDTINQREFGPPASLESEKPSPLQQRYDELVTCISQGRDNIRNQPIAALCWAIAVDAALLDRSLRTDARRVLGAAGRPCDQLDDVRFHHTVKFHRDNPGRPELDLFNDYVRTRWPIVTFGIDPVTDQQNIADSFNLRRDLQLALSYSFATGQIGFNQLNTFRRQLEQSADTIALNRTVTGFSHGNDIFGFRFTPRYQNPPNQRTNLGVVASQLISGGPGPDYQVKKSRLEPGMRELTAVVLVPTFLTNMRMQVTTNWFKLNDPEHLVFRSERMMEQGRMLQELRQTVLDYCSHQRYRPDDLRVLQSKLAMLEAMLPAQSKVMPLPYENSASGFDLLSDGATALVPELTGFSGVDVIRLPEAPATPASVSDSSPPGLQVRTTTTTPATTTTVSVVGGTGSLADVFIFGKFISLLDTKVIAGGKATAFEILSREVVHVQVPANAEPTTDNAGNTYVEVFLATPNGISNSVYIPCIPPPSKAAPAPPQVAFNLATTGLDLYYQASGDRLINSAPPSKPAISIGWDSPNGLAPRKILATFQGTVANAPVSFALQADSGASDDYKIDAQAFANALLGRVRDALAASGGTPQSAAASPKFDVFVQPLIPADGGEFRVRTEAKKLATPLTVNLRFQITGADARQSGQTGLAPRRPEGLDPALSRTSQLPALPPAAPADLDLPQLPPPMDGRILQSPNVASEAEQVARLLTGQGSDPNRATSIPSGLGGGAATQTVTVVTPNPTVGGQPIVVMPAPVVVVPAPAEPKHKSLLRPGQAIRKLGNRLSQGGSVVPR